MPKPKAKKLRSTPEEKEKEEDWVRSLEGVVKPVTIIISVAPEPRLGSVLARALDQKARLSSARTIFQKARFTKNCPKRA